MSTPKVDLSQMVCSLSYCYHLKKFVGLCVPEGDTIIAGCVEVCEDSFDSLVVALGRSLGRTQYHRERNCARLGAFENVKATRNLRVVGANCAKHTAEARRLAERYGST